MGFFRSLFGSGEEEPEQQPNKPSQDGKKGNQEDTSFDTLEIDRLVDTGQLMEDKAPDTGLLDPLDSATRQLPIEKIVSYNNKRLRFGHSIDVGVQRDNNEDSLVAYYSTADSAEDLPDFGVFVVADGMGGHSRGEVASAMTTRIIAQEAMREIHLPVLTGTELSEMPPIAEVLISAVEKANKDVHAEIENGGTTCTAVVYLRNRAYIAHVGDSRAYFIKKGELEQVTTDHTMAQRLKEIGQIKEGDDERDIPNKLYRAVGFAEEVEIDAMSRNLTGAKMLLCSDGLWNHVTDDELLEIVESVDDPQEACDKLVALANTKGGSDNISVILLEMRK